MKQRDLYYLQELAKYGKLKFVNLSQIGEYAVAEATNGFCYLMIKDKNNKRFTQGFFSFTGKGARDEIQLPQGYEIRTLEGKNIGNYHHTEPFDIVTGEQGEFTAVFDREELLYFLKYALAGWRTEDANKYVLTFHRDIDCWRLRGYEHKKVHIKELPAEGNISDRTFRFTVNPHTFRLILKWFECDKVTMYFRNGNYECKSPIFMHDDNKLAVLMPIARVK